MREEELNCLQVASLYEVPILSQGLLLEESGGTGTIVGLQKKGLLDRVDSDRFSLHDSLRDYLRRGLPRERKEALVEKAIPWLSKEAEAAEQRGEPEDAIAFVENALMIEVDPLRRLSTLEQLGDLRELVGDYPGATEVYQIAIGEAGEAGQMARLHEKAAGSLIWSGLLEEAEQEIETGLNLLPSGPSPEAARLLIQRTEIDLLREDFKRVREDLERVTS